MSLLKTTLDNRFAFFDFVKNGKKIENAPVCGMTLLAAGSMRFRWNENNVLRKNILTELSGFSKNNSIPTPVELIHSQIVCDASAAEETLNVQADGIITKNNALMPVVTVADCMPLYLYNENTGTFGVVHSGWKGTGIVGEAIRLAQKNHNAKPEDFSVVIGPHIRDCCYIVNEERMQYFAKNFTPDCVKELEDGGSCYAGGRGLPITWNNGGGKLYRLSLEKANLAVLERAGVPKENINIVEDCTCCNTLLGSNRRETAQCEANGNPPNFTVQAAFIYF